MSLESLKKALDSVENEDAKNALLKIYEDDLAAETKLGVDKYNKKDGEHLKLRGAIKDTGYDPEKFATLKEYIESFKSVNEKANEGDLAYTALEQKFTALETQLADEKVVAKNSSLEAKLTKELGDVFIGKSSSLMIDKLIAGGKVDLQDGKYFFKDGDNVTDFESGVKSLKETYKDLLKSDQNGGSGDTGGNASSADDADAEFKALEAQMLKD